MANTAASANAVPRPAAGVPLRTGGSAGAGGVGCVVALAGGLGMRRAVPAGGAQSRQARIERQAQRQMQPHPAQAGAAPAPLAFHERRERPAKRAGEPGQQGDAGDGAARAAAVEPHQRSKRRLVQTRTHGQADDDPGRKQAPRPLGTGQRAQPGGKGQAGQWQDRPPAEAVDRATGPGAQQRRHRQGQRKRRIHPRGRNAEVMRHRRGQNRRQVVRGGPGQGLRRPESGDGAPAQIVCHAWIMGGRARHGSARHGQAHSEYIFDNYRLTPA